MCCKCCTCCKNNQSGYQPKKEVKPEFVLPPPLIRVGPPKKP